MYKGKKRSAGGSRAGDSITIMVDDESDEENRPPDPKVERDIQMLTKLPNSGAAKVCYNNIAQVHYRPQRSNFQNFLKKQGK